MNKRIRRKKLKQYNKLISNTFESWMKIYNIQLQVYNIIRMYQELKTDKKFIEGGIIVKPNYNVNENDEKEVIIPLNKLINGDKFTINIEKIKP